MHKALLRCLSVLATLSLSSPAWGTFHMMKIREVFAGSAGQPNAQYVALQMFQGGQNLVDGHVLTVYNAAGGTAGTFPFTADVANDANQSFILIATTEAATMFGVTADLAMTAVLDPTGGKVCFEDVDCVSWGSFSGSSLSPSPSGTAYGPAGGILLGHAIRRDISHGNSSTLQGSDDSDDSHADFDCVATAMPTNNAGASGTYTDPSACPVCGNNTLETGEVCDGTADLACPGGCEDTCLCPVHDAVVLPLRPIKLKVPIDVPMVKTKRVRVAVRNGDTHKGSDDIKLVGSPGDCPAGVTFTTPDFNPPAGDDTIKLGSGDKGRAQVIVSVDSTAFATFNHKAPKRCTLLFTAQTDIAGNTDPRPGNDAVPLEINVVDLNDAETASPPHETHIVSLKPLKVTIPDDAVSKLKKVKPAVGNADILPAPDVGDVITLLADVSGCTGVTITSLDADKKIDGNQTSVPVDGGKLGKGLVVLSFDPALINTPNPASQARCIATFTASGPEAPSPDPDPTNNETQLVIDIIDKNDYD